MVEVNEMNKGELVAKNNLKGLMELYREIVNKAIFIAKRF